MSGGLVACRSSDYASFFQRFSARGCKFGHRITPKTLRFDDAISALGSRPSAVQMQFIRLAVRRLNLRQH
jgi:hypothetical protein